MNCLLNQVIALGGTTLNTVRVKGHGRSEIALEESLVRHRQPVGPGRQRNWDGRKLYPAPPMPLQ